ncbi:MAG TPA: beta-ketoacyl-[acyl-carrier-protein] synthase family protein [Methylomirabilota bacterium]|jgi:3-oxoacyl-[acyl-carrier-protein] synthase II|nr:beta-ketoacyl-[acyl-carrier-protein] synthase family protein [Methylomirabilota bacterium]
MREVVVTGLGAVSPYGAGVAAYWKGLAAGACAIRELTLIETAGFRCRLAAEVPGPLPGSPRRTRADRLALAATGEALEDAGLGARERAGAALVVGAVGGGMLEAEAWYWRAARDGARPVPLAAVRAVLPCAHAETVAARFRLGGPRHTVVTACSSGAVALAEAAELVADGVVDVAVAGGVDAITRICFMGFNALRLLDAEACRPFDRERRGMSIGEGAGFMVLEPAARARARGARVYATLAGHGMTTDAYHVTAPEPEGDGMARAMAAALGHAGLSARDVQYANAHGTGTPQNDRIEARALARIFGEGGVLVSSSKSMIGHTMAAAGSLEAIATVLALEHGVVPPTANLATPDPDVPFDCVPRTARAARVECAISNSFGFGGQNVTLLFRKSA